MTFLEIHGGDLSELLSSPRGLGSYIRVFFDAPVGAPSGAMEYTAFIAQGTGLLHRAIR
jgi:hypothetical protein